MAFKALVVPEFGQAAEVHDIITDDLPAGDVIVQVHFSSLNYKDGLALTSKGKVLRNFPAVPGIDLAGTVMSSEAARFRKGDSVLATGFGIGETTWGGYAQYARLSSSWLVPLPPGLSFQRAMAIGTAGFTAMLSVMALEDRGIRPDRGDVLVTGATGGVGSCAVSILANLGYSVVASTGRMSEAAYLRSLGARDVVDRALLSAPSRPIEHAIWSAAVDSVGGSTLAHIMSKIKYGGAIAVCGLAGGSEFTATVLPLILRGVDLLGINSVDTPMDRRIVAWRRVAVDLPSDKLTTMTRVAALSEAPRLADEILKGRVRGRTVIDVNA